MAFLIKHSHRCLGQWTLLPFSRSCRSHWWFSGWLYVVGCLTRSFLLDPVEDSFWASKTDFRNRNLGRCMLSGARIFMVRLKSNVGMLIVLTLLSLLYPDPVISFRVYKRHIVVLNSAEAISDLLGRKADIYSDRPMSWMYNVVCGRGKAIFNISASDPRHKQYRKLLQSGLGIRATRDYVPLIERESRRLVQGLIQTPEQLITHIQRYVQGKPSSVHPFLY